MSGDALTEAEWRDLILSVNTHVGKRPRLPCEVAELLSRALRTSSPQAIAAKVGFKDATMVGRLHALSSLPARVQELIDWRAGAGSVNMSTASQLARIRNRRGGTPDKDIEAAFRAVIEHRLTSKEARDLAQSYLRGTGEIAEALKAVLGSRPRREQQHVILGAITSPTLQARLSAMNAPERQGPLQRALAHLFPSVEFDAARLARKHFVLVLTEENFQILQGMLGGDSLEGRLESALEAEMDGKVS